MKRLSFILLLLAALMAASCSSKKATAVYKPKYPGAVTTVKVIPSTEKQLKQLIAEANSWIGTPYKYGNSTKRKGTDCSGFVMRLFDDVYNLKLPRSSAMQQEAVTPVKFDKMKPGDLVFFSSPKNSRRVNHVGLYVGDNRMIHASTSRGVINSSLSEQYWKNSYYSSGRVIETAAKGKAQSPALPQTEPVAVPEPQPKPKEQPKQKENKPKRQPKPKEQPKPKQEQKQKDPQKDLQNILNVLDQQIDSIYVTNPEIFD